MFQQAGYAVRDACQALGISRSAYYAAQRVDGARPRRDPEADHVLVVLMQQIKDAHLFWGYRRVWAWLRFRLAVVVNQKKVRRLMKEHGLMVPKKLHKAKRTPTRSKPRANRPRQIWGMDMTKFIIDGLGWVYLVIVLDWYTKKIVGWDMALRSKTAEWRRALDMALNREFPNGVRDQGLNLVSDNGSQPTSVAFMRGTAELGINQIFTSYNNPKGNADTERMIQTIKQEVIWVNEFKGYEDALEKFRSWVEIDYNRLYLYKKLGHRSPEEFEAWYNQESAKKAG
jgi:transposase InsO family protein